MTEVTPITLNLQAPNVNVIVHAKEGDRAGRFINAKLIDGAREFIPPENAHFVVRYMKADGNGGLYDTMEDNETPAVTLSGNIATIGIAEQALTVPGRVAMELNIYDHTGKRISAFTFTMVVEETVMPDGNVESTEYFNILTHEIALALQASDVVQAVVDMTVEAEELPAGSTPTVEKDYDPDAGTLKLTFGLVKGQDGKTAYQSAVDGGYEGTEAEFNVELAGLNEAAAAAAASAAAAAQSKEDVEALVETVTGNVGIDDDYTGMATTWSSNKINENFKEIKENVFTTETIKVTESGTVAGTGTINIACIGNSQVKFYGTSGAARYVRFFGGKLDVLTSSENPTDKELNTGVYRISIKCLQGNTERNGIIITSTSSGDTANRIIAYDGDIVTVDAESIISVGTGSNVEYGTESEPTIYEYHLYTVTTEGLEKEIDDEVERATNAEKKISTALKESAIFGTELSFEQGTLSSTTGGEQSSNYAIRTQYISINSNSIIYTGQNSVNNANVYLNVYQYKDEDGTKTFIRRSTVKDANSESVWTELHKDCTHIRLVYGHESSTGVRMSTSDGKYLICALRFYYGFGNYYKYPNFYTNGEGTELLPFESADGTAGMGEAIGSITNGGKIHVYNGIYNITEQIVINKRNINIEGDVWNYPQDPNGVYPSITGVKFALLSDDIPSVFYSNVDISGMRISQIGIQGLTTIWDQTDADGNDETYYFNPSSIKNVGYYIGNGGRVDQCNFHRVSFCGLAVGILAKYTIDANVWSEINTDGCDFGIFVDYSTCHHPKILNNITSDCTGCGIFYKSVAGQNSYGLVAHGNVLVRNASYLTSEQISYGIPQASLCLIGHRYASVCENTIVLSGVYKRKTGGTNYTAYPGGVGLYFTGSYSVISNNKITQSTGQAAYIEGDYNNIIGNNIEDENDGFELLGDYNIISGNIIDSKLDIIGDNNQIKQNVITGNVTLSGDNNIIEGTAANTITVSGNNNILIGFDADNVTDNGTGTVIK